MSIIIGKNVIAETVYDEVTCGFVSAAIANENTRTRRRNQAGVEGELFWGTVKEVA